MSEEEALHVIVEELSRAGISISQTNVTMEKLAVEQEFRRTPNGAVLNGRTVSGPDSPGAVKPLEVDGLSDDGAVAFEYVSQSDYKNFGGLLSMSTATNYDLLPVARSLAERVAETDEAVYFGTFYDPVTLLSNTPRPLEPAGQIDFRETARQRYTRAQEMSRQRLREQVADFVNWLKAQGAI